MEIPESAVHLALDLYRRRMLFGSRRTLLDAVAEASVVAFYHRVLTIDELDPKLDLTLTDDGGRRVRIVTGRGWPLQVRAQQLDAGDVYVFAHAESKEEGQLYGWLPSHLVEQAPIEWFVKNGKRFNYAHRIDHPGYLSPMPVTFDYGGCPHLEQYGGLWDDRKEAWECCKCGQFLYDAVHRDEFLPGYRQRARDDRMGHKKQTGEEGVERPQDE